MLSINYAAAAILVHEDGRILMQLRDDRPDIWYPNHWGLFGGGVEAGESPEEALCWELKSLSW
jgi:8-oxo-dGTP pyrophosphatase MutT (NUDIX family)